MKKEIIRYLTSQQRKDGGWGLCVHSFKAFLFLLMNFDSHIESDSTMFGTAMNYCTMRILGLPRADPRMVKSREWIEKKGTRFATFFSGLIEPCFL